jgi:DNA-3-methyladenine glycosylase I
MKAPANRDLVAGDDGIVRCWWCAGDALYMRYHDAEWGRPVANDIRLFEKLCLEGFQAGLSWITILRKRENFRDAFHGFDPERIAAMTGRDVNRLLKNDGIVRHRGKIEATISNARRLPDLIEETGSLARHVWRFEPPAASRPRIMSRSDIAPTTPESVALSTDLRRRGWRFVGPTTVHAFMQAMGLVNDHVEGCAAGREARRARAEFRTPCQ